MADGEENDKDSLLQNHKKERRELQARIQELKNAVPKGDKRQKKEVAAQIALLEHQLEKKHSEELSKLQIEATTSLSDIEQNGPAGDSVLSTDLSNGFQLSLNDSTPKEKGRVSKAQKRRDKKAMAANEREARIAEQEIENLQGQRHLEEVGLRDLLHKRGLTLHQIPADGNCLYQAVLHQLSLKKGTNPEHSKVPGLRLATATQMRENRDSYLPFLTNPQTGDTLTPEEFEAYCTDLQSTNVWGGHIELRAMSESLKVPIEVVQASGPSIFLGEEFNSEEKTPLVISYHRHAYGLGEHYNSVIGKTAEDGADETENNL